MCIMREMKTSTERPIDPLSDVASLSTATAEDDENDEAAPSEMPSANAWKRRPTNVEKAGDLESNGSSMMDSLNCRIRDVDAATVKYSPCPEEGLAPIRSSSRSVE